ncbi:MAG: response regulator transcription factor [Verrucomicrobia bacterium]|nr:MAG: response regulator transcription factor [Verrucomicrobiota bacterium]
MMKIRALIVDDQLIAREAIRRMLTTENDIEVVALSTTGQEALEAIKTHSPDLVFLDVRLPDMDGFSVLAELPQQRLPVIVFVTANDEFALQAFDVHALDYVVKPISPERLQRALQRAREHLQQRRGGNMDQRLGALLRDLKTSPRQTDRLAVKSSGKVVFLRLADIDWVESADNYVKLHVGSESHMLRETMNALEQRMPADRFIRISRSALVNVEKIKELHPMFHGEYVVVLTNGTRVNLTRSYRDKLELLGVG